LARSCEGIPINFAHVREEGKEELELVVAAAAEEGGEKHQED